jgi:hypothetical protein
MNLQTGGGCDWMLGERGRCRGKEGDGLGLERAFMAGRELCKVLLLDNSKELATRRVLLVLFHSSIVHL